MSDRISEAGQEDYKTSGDITYRPHSLMHKAVVTMDETNLEMLDNFERIDSGYKFVPDDSNVRVIISGRDWSEKRLFIYGCMSSDKATKHVETIINRVTDVGHDAELIDPPTITNIAVSGDFGTPLQLNALVHRFREYGLDVEYEPEQFPALIVKTESRSATFLLFSTGKFGIQGINRFEDIEPAIQQVVSYIPDIGHPEESSS